MVLASKKRGFTLIRRKVFTLITHAFTGVKVKRPAFTLIELLVSVAIFSGIVVLALGAFARSADSSIKSSAVRERTEAARTVVDRIGNDMQYVYTDNEFVAGVNECNSIASNALGFSYNDNCLIMLLNYPDSDKLVLKKYLRVNQNSRESIHLEEARNCNITATNTILCDPERTFFSSDILDGKFSVVDASDAVFANDALFGGINPIQAVQQNVTAILEVNVVVKPSAYSGTCAADSTKCYIIKSSFVLGS